MEKKQRIVSCHNEVLGLTKTLYKHPTGKRMIAREHSFQGPTYLGAMTFTHICLESPRIKGILLDEEWDIIQKPLGFSSILLWHVMDKQISGNVTNKCSHIRNVYCITGPVYFSRQGELARHATFIPHFLWTSSMASNLFPTLNSRPNDHF